MKTKLMLIFLALSTQAICSDNKEQEPNLPNQVNIDVQERKEVEEHNTAQSNTVNELAPQQITTNNSCCSEVVLERNLPRLQKPFFHSIVGALCISLLFCHNNDPMHAMAWSSPIMLSILYSWIEACCCKPRTD